MKSELNLIESQILRIFRNNKKKADDSMDTKKILDDSLKALEHMPQFDQHLKCQPIDFH